MSDDQQTKTDDENDDFATQADQAEMGLLAEFWDFLIHNKKWWLTPIILVLLAMGVLIVLSGTAAAPFIYTLW
jgi:hypothetical protein